MLVHLQIISAKAIKLPKAILNFSISGGLRKGKTYFFGVSICLHFEWLVEFAQMKTTHSLQVVVAQKEVETL